MRDDHIICMRLPNPSWAASHVHSDRTTSCRDAAQETLAAEHPSSRRSNAPDAPAPPSASGAVPSSRCEWMFPCPHPVVAHGLCQKHCDLTADIRADWEDRAADFEDGWTDGH